MALLHTHSSEGVRRGGVLLWSSTSTDTMTEAGALLWRCPVGHEVKVFLPGETEKVRLRVWCTQCDRDYKYRVPGRAPADLDLFGGND